MLYRMAEMLESRAAGFEQLLVDVADYNKDDAKREVEVSIDRLIYYAGWSDKFHQVFGCTNPVASPHFNFTFPEATGVVASLTSKTSPLLGLISAMAPIIVSGNTCVLIVDNAAPMVSIDFAEVLHNSDLPGGVVNIITGLREELDSHVSSHMDVDGLLGFGVSDDDRRDIQIAGTENIKRVKFLPDYKRDDWRDDDRQTPYWILPFVEFKTAWHPMGS
ncbi:MAG: acyl-CoA reductase-like NAD-dependent aldehyde dehydrogenase [Myxococcota bacterium]